MFVHYPCQILLRTLNSLTSSHGHWNVELAVFTHFIWHVVSWFVRDRARKHVVVDKYVQEYEDLESAVAGVQETLDGCTLTPTLVVLARQHRSHRGSLCHFLNKFFIVFIFLSRKKSSSRKIICTCIFILYIYYLLNSFRSNDEAHTPRRRRR